MQPSRWDGCRLLLRAVVMAEATGPCTAGTAVMRRFNRSINADGNTNKSSDKSTATIDINAVADGSFWRSEALWSGR